MVKFVNEKIAYNSVTVQMDNRAFENAVNAYKIVRYSDETSSALPDKETLKHELKQTLLNELENMLEYEDTIDKLRICFNEENCECDRYMEMKLKHQLVDEFEHEVVVEEFSVIEVL